MKDTKNTAPEADTSQTTPTGAIDHLIVGPGPTKHPHNGLILVGLLLVVLGLGGSALVYKNKHETTGTTKTAASTPTPTPIPAMKTLDAQVSLTGTSFSPASMRLKTGSQVTWVNSSTVAQSLTSPQLDDFASDTLQPQDSYSFTFELAGTYTITNGTNAMTVTVK